ncbi:hypothetical protein [Paenibacillus sp. OSY-SE]|uniref:hypothetical protein n=1 Tax=Paenibacillus sp. OSY-SE TaxID=1196323 RepID=UPI000361054A|nr:hypothetical protein [Paenibacillus sp. OSY-SE]
MIAFTTMFGTIVPAQANQAPAAATQLSKWSLGVLNEGEKYGVFPIAWYYDGFQEQISQDKLQSLLEATSNKLASLGLKVKSNLSSQTFKTDITREIVMNSLYNVLAQYKLPETLEIDKQTPLDYLQKRGIVTGTGNGLELEKSCTVEQAAVIASRLIKDTYAAVGGGAKGLLWKVSNGNNTLYLLG